MSSNTSVVHFTFHILDITQAPVLKHVMDNLLKPNLAGSIYGLTDESTEEQAVFRMDYQADVPTHYLKDTLTTLDDVRSYTDVLGEGLSGYCLFQDSEVKVIPNQNQDPEAEALELKQVNAFLMNRNDMLTNEVDEHANIIEELTAKVDHMATQIQKLDLEVRAVKTYHYESSGISKLWKVVHDMAEALGCAEVLKDYKPHTIQ